MSFIESFSEAAAPGSVVVIGPGTRATVAPVAQFELFRHHRMRFANSSFELIETPNRLELFNFPLLAQQLHAPLPPPTPSFSQQASATCLPTEHVDPVSRVCATEPFFQR